MALEDVGANPNVKQFVERLVKIDFVQLHLKKKCKLNHAHIYMYTPQASLLCRSVRPLKNLNTIMFSVLVFSDESSVNRANSLTLVQQI